MPDNRQTAQEHAATLLDVVFGIVIADPIVELPKLAVSAATLNPVALTDFSLNLSAIIFCAFYWLETKGFLEDSSTLFGRRSQNEYFDDRGVSGQLRFDLIGGLYLVTVASAVIAFSNLENLGLLLLFSAGFWAGDLFGTLDLRRRYAPWRDKVLQQKDRASLMVRWWAGHVGSAFFIWYGILNITFYLGLYGVLRWGDSSSGTELLVAAAAFVFCTFRHLVWRSMIYCAIRDRWLARTPAS